ncbi:MMPL family transporter [Streptomyces sp. 549]|uniref:MMPL family transporter n=1 Tax=Streptomyces sp. 549 TaxID=3049076 RepID=UPI0024C30E13|nr:MMPL family transporter [Streptomyces sp. 549]MDK1472746.1 MMPL family transporter [Streptomyces sp. 549]
MAALARWCLRHRWVVIGLWLVTLLGTGTGAAVAGSSYAAVFSSPGSESSKAIERMQEAFPDQAGDTSSVVWRVADGSVRDPEVRERMTEVLDGIGGMPDVGRVVSPYSEEGAAQVSEDGTIAYAQVTFTEQAFELKPANTEALIEHAREAATDDLDVALGGMAIEQTQNPAAGLAEAVAIVAAAIVLFVAFGSLFAMLLPLLNAGFAVGTGVAVTILLTHVWDLPDVATLLGSLIGLGVGIDYALFIVTRHRKGLRMGLDPHESAVRAMNTSGRAVLFAGGTVCVALLAMFTLRLQFMDGIAIATTLTVVLSVIAAATLLPAMFGVLGLRVLSRKERQRLAEDGPVDDETASGLAIRWSGVVQRRPKLLVVVSMVVMLVLSIPVLSLRLGANDQGNQLESQTTRQAYDMLADGFGPGFNGPLQLVGETPGAAERKALADATEEISQLPGVVVAFPATPPDADVSVVQVVPTTSPQAEETDELIDSLRERFADGEVTVYIGGGTAMQKDFATLIGDRLPGFILLIIGLGALLLMLAFRSIVVPLTAAVMNLIAAAASFGALVAIFQWGWGIELLNMGKEGPILAFLPVIMLPLLFGLSMDYQVFLVSRMHEVWVHTGDNARAVRAGLADTSRVINCAALIMICVFASFILSGSREAGMAGMGLAIAVALDAFVLRTLLVPAAMHLLGRSNWWLPQWLDRRMPHLSVDPPDEPLPQDAAQHAFGGAGIDGGGGSGQNRVPVLVGAEPGREGDAGAASSGAATASSSGTSAAGGRKGSSAADPGGPVIRGTVRDALGVPLPRAALTLLASDGRQVAKVRSAEDGGYSVSAPGSGSYVLVATSPSLGARREDVLLGDGPVDLDLHIEVPGTGG